MRNPQHHPSAVSPWRVLRFLRQNEYIRHEMEITHLGPGIAQLVAFTARLPRPYSKTSSAHVFRICDIRLMVVNRWLDVVMLSRNMPGSPWVQEYAESLEIS